MNLEEQPQPANTQGTSLEEKLSQITCTRRAAIGGILTFLTAVVAVGVDAQITNAQEQAEVFPGTWKWSPEKCKDPFVSIGRPSMSSYYAPGKYDGFFGIPYTFEINGNTFAIAIPKSATGEMECSISQEEINAIESAIRKIISIIPEGTRLPNVSYLQHTKTQQELACIPIIFRRTYEQRMGFYGSMEACLATDEGVNSADYANFAPPLSRMMEIFVTQSVSEELGSYYSMWLELVSMHEYWHFLQGNVNEYFKESLGFYVPYGKESFATWMIFNLYPEMLEHFPNEYDIFICELVEEIEAKFLLSEKYPFDFLKPILPEDNRPDYSNFIFWEAIFQIVKRNTPDVPDAILLQNVMQLHFNILETLNLETPELLNAGDILILQQQWKTIIENELLQDLGLDIGMVQAQILTMLLDKNHWIQIFSESQLPELASNVELPTSPNEVQVGLNDINSNQALYRYQTDEDTRLSIKTLPYEDSLYPSSYILVVPALGNPYITYISPLESTVQSINQIDIPAGSTFYVYVATTTQITSPLLAIRKVDIEN